MKRAMRRLTRSVEDEDEDNNNDDEDDAMSDTVG